MDAINRLLYFRIPKEWEYAKRREYKLINCIFLFFGILTLVFVFVSLNMDAVEAAILHGVFTIIYIIGYLITFKITLKQVRLYLLYSFKIPVFLYSLFIYFPVNNAIIPYYSPLIILFIVFPVVASLFELSIRNHFVVTICLLVLNLVLLPYIPRSFMDILPAYYDKVMVIIACPVFAIFLIGILTNEVYIKHKIYATNERFQAKKLQLILEDLSKSLTTLKAQKIKIEQQSKELQDLNTSKDKLFSIISHDLRSPFNAILGFIDLLKTNNYSKKEQKRIINILHESANNAYSLINNLLAWSRSQMEKIRVSPMEVDLHDTLHECIQIYSTISQNKGIKITHNIESHITAITDPNILITVCRNILSNSIKYTNPNGEVRVNIKKMGAIIDISISDNGVGIPNESMPCLFTYDLNKSTPGTENEKGTGLGLPICKEFLQKINGRLEVESTVGEGSVFHIILPIEFNINDT